MALTLARGNVGGAAHRRPPYFKTKKLAILGSTQNLEDAPWFDPSWTLAAHPCCRPRCKREPDWYFDLHPPSCFTKETKGWNQKYFAWLKTLQTPIFMQEETKAPWNEIPLAVRYPKERIFAEFRQYFTNHCAYLIALAMTEGVTHIGLFGCQYSHETEHGVQRDSLTYWLGRFEQAGGTLVLPPRFNTLLASPKELYGYESHDADGKLVSAYRVKPVIVAKNDKGETEKRQLVPVEADGSCAVPLMALPNQEAPAWNRSGLRLTGTRG